MLQTNIWEMALSTVYMYRLLAVLIYMLRILPIFKRNNEVSVTKIGVDGIIVPD